LQASVFYGWEWLKLQFNFGGNLPIDDEMEAGREWDKKVKKKKWALYVVFEGDGCPFSGTFCPD